MPDSASSSDPRVQAQLDRLSYLSPGADILGLSRISELLRRFGDPHLKLPPVLHVAGTNGKGSTCAYLRAAIEAAGRKVHVFSSPHLVRFNERIRVAGRLIEDAELAPLLEEVLDVGGDIGASFFEVGTAAAFLAFSRTPADACIVEVGVGGRLDATNVIVDPAVCGVAQLGIDHQAFLGDTIFDIAYEKASIAKPGRPLVTLGYAPEIAAVVEKTAAEIGAPWFVQGRDWSHAVRGGQLHYRDAHGEVVTPLPSLPGAHQHTNVALALAMLRHQDRVALPETALASAPRDIQWPARMQQLSQGPLRDLLPPGGEIWLDGVHNPAAAEVVSAALAERLAGRKAHLVLGVLANKDAQGLLAPFAPLAESIVAVPVPSHEHHAPELLAEGARAIGIAKASVAPDVPAALQSIARYAGDAPVVMVMGSLYLAGKVLEANDEIPD
jgi:dihydrofolate synthase/folylpolyglutamate synthase